MIRLKNKKAEKESDAKSSSNGVDDNRKGEMDVAENKDEVEAEGEEDAKSSGLKILGIGGKASRTTGGAAKVGKKKSPGEIRIQKDISDLDGGKVAQVLFPNPNDLTNFNVMIVPDSGYWSGAKYKFTFVIPPIYPHEPPKVTCNTKIYHPNIDLAGAVCLNILREDWKPVLDVNAVIYGLICLFEDPNPDDPLNREAADLYRTDRAQFARVVKRSLQGSNVGGEVFDKLI